MKVSHTKCQCTECKHFFKSTFAFDKHRAGTHGADRRCMSEDEMRAKGMDRNQAGYWISAKREVFA